VNNSIERCLEEQPAQFLGLVINWLTVVARDAGDMSRVEQMKRYTLVNEAIHYYSGFLCLKFEQIDLPLFIQELSRHVGNGLLPREELDRIVSICVKAP